VHPKHSTLAGIKGTYSKGRERVRREEGEEREGKAGERKRKRERGGKTGSRPRVYLYYFPYAKISIFRTAICQLVQLSSVVARTGFNAES